MNPDGTYTLEQGLFPMFARRVDGSWTAADATLRRNNDGTLSPVASVFPMVLSGGGSGPLLIMSKGAARMSLSWPTVLPAPTFSGSTATYASVLPSVDLRVQVGTGDVATLLVIKDAAAAKNPALRSLQLKTGLTGLSLHTDAASGAISAVDGHGQEVFSAGTPLMWDSSAAPAAASAPAGASKSAGGSNSADSAGAQPGVPATSAAGAAVETHKSKPVKVSVSKDALTLAPDVGMLTDPATTFPVVLDPPFTGYRNHWALLRKSSPNTSYWDIPEGRINTDDKTSGAIRAGYSDWSGIFTDRSLFEMNIAGLAGREITAAYFSLRQQWSGAGCGNTSAQPDYLWWTGAISPANTWNQQPSWLSKLVGTTAVHRYGDSCPPGDVNFDVTGTVQSAANAGATALTFGLKADNESNDTTWRRYDLGAQGHPPALVVTYQTRPNTPDTLQSNGSNCVTGSERPAVPGVPVLSAHVYDADADVVYLTEQLAPINADGSYGAWSTVPGQPQETATYPYTTRPSATISGLADDHAYAWRAMATDATGRTSGWTGACEFLVDAGGPPAPTVSSPDYPYNPTNCAGGPGVAGTFTFQPNATDVVSYNYQWNSGPATTVPVPRGQPLTITLNPPPPDPLKPWIGGITHLHVGSKDAVGHPSTANVDYQTKLCEGANEAAIWAMDATDDGNLTLTDTSTNPTPHPASFPAGANPDNVWSDWTERRLPAEPTIHLDGTTAASTTGPVLTTNKSYTVTAWARLSSLTGVSTVVSQYGTHTSGFQLQYRADQSAWCFAARTTDTAAAPLTHACAVTPKLGVWTHLAGVYDAGQGADGLGRLRLYVNGVKVAVASFTASWNATGPVDIGKDRDNGASLDKFVGAIDEARLWQRALTDTEIRSQGATLVGAWSFDDGPAIASDYTMLHDGYWTDPWSDPAPTSQANGHSVDLGTGDGSTYGVHCDGSTGEVVMSDAALQTEQSFTVSAWVKLDRVDVQQAVVAQGGDYMPAFKLELDEGMWEAVMTSADVEEPTYFNAWSDEPAQANVWYHLITVFDAQAGELRLYVGRGSAAPVLQYEKATGVTGWQAWGNFTVCQAAWWLYLQGSVDDVVAYAGIVPDSDITDPNSSRWAPWS